MNWRDVRECYGRGYEQYLKHLLSLFPRNGHWRRVSDLVGKVNPKHDLMRALKFLVLNGEITVDESCVSITKWKLGGEAMEPAPRHDFNSHRLFAPKAHKGPDSVRR